MISESNSSQGENVISGKYRLPTESFKIWSVVKPESTEGVGRVSVLKRQEGAPLNLG